MNKLVRYFLFFVAAAIILIQCARFFPSGRRQSDNTSLPAKKAASRKSANQVPATKTSANVSAPAVATKAQQFSLNQPSFTINMVNYISRYQFLSYQYWSLYRNVLDTRQLFKDSLNNLLDRGLLTNNRNGLASNDLSDTKK